MVIFVHMRDLYELQQLYYGVHMCAATNGQRPTPYFVVAGNTIFPGEPDSAALSCFTG